VAGRRPIASDLLGRDDLIADIETRIAALTAVGNAVVIRLTGPPGIGKSAVCAALLRRAASRGATPIATTAIQVEEHATLSVASRLSGRPRLAENADAAAHEMGRALRARVEAADTTVIVVDDLQWADGMSMRIVAQLARSLSPRLHVLVTDRSSQPRHGVWDRDIVTIPPLRWSAAVELVRALRPGADAALVNEIVGGANGVPFVLRVLAETSSAAGSTGSVEATLRARLDRCTPRAADVLFTAACIPEPIPIDVLSAASVVQLMEVAAILTEASDLIRVDGPLVSFRHDALAAGIRAVDSTLGDHDRRVLDAQRAIDPDSEGGLARIVHAATRCGDRGILAQALAGAGHAAAARGAWSEAVARLTQARELQRADLRIAVALALALRALFREEEAVGVLRPLVAGAIRDEDVVAISWLLRPYWAAMFTLERFDEIDALLDACDRVARTERHAGLKAIVSSARRATAAMSLDIERFDSLPPADDPLDLRSSAYVAAHRGDPQTARRTFSQWRAERDGAEPSAEVFDEALETIVRFLETGPDAVPSRFLERLVAGTASPPEAHLAVAAAVAIGEWGQIDSTLSSRMSEATSLVERLAVHEERTILCAFRCIEIDRRADLLHDLRSAFGKGRPRLALTAAVWFIAAELRRGARPPNDIVANVAQNATLLAHLHGAHLAYPVALAMVEPVIGDVATRAIAGFDRLGARWHRAHSMLAGGWLRDEPNALHEAHDLFAAMNAKGLAMIAAGRGRFMNAEQHAFARRLHYGGAGQLVVPLTKRECEVADLVAAGHTNRSVATALDVSERTVEVHLTRIYEKLGVSSRTQLALGWPTT
jgi:DNA-binding CsgD family transcriptional regulator